MYYTKSSHGFDSVNLGPIFLRSSSVLSPPDALHTVARVNWTALKPWPIYSLHVLRSVRGVLGPRRGPSTIGLTLATGPPDFQVELCYSFLRGSLPVLVDFSRDFVYSLVAY